MPTIHDIEFNEMLVKSMVDTGWCFRNRFLGAPFGMQLYDFPPWDNLSMSMMKLVSLFTSNYAAILNLYFLLTFPLTVIASLVAFRASRISYPSAIVASILFAFMPCHFMRGEGHIFLAAYYPVPLITMVIVWLALGEPLQPQEPGARRWLPGGRLSWAIVIAILVGSGERYHAFFACLLLCVAAVAASLRAGTTRAARPAVMLAGLIALSGVVNGAPNIAYEQKHGRNTEAIVRSPQEAELYGLKITEMLLPVSGHRIRYLAALKDRYLQWTQSPELALQAVYGRPGHPLANEADTASLGLVAGAGFVFLAGLLLFGRKAGNRDLVQTLAMLTMGAVLIGTVGGGGSLFSFVVSPLFRCYNRLSIYVAFFSLFAVALLLDDLRRRLARVRCAAAIWYAVLALVLCVGILDQTTPEFVPRYEELASEFSSDAQFVRQIQANLPRGAMIFQLPYAPFPELGPVNKVRAWDLFKGYLHANGLRWSYGVITGRPEARWAERFANESLDQVVKTLAFAGFNGIYIDRYGYVDNAAGLESGLGGVLHESPLVSINGRLSFFNLTDFAGLLKTGLSTVEWQRLHSDAVRLPAPN